jgi:hypothetical protein
MSRPEHLKYLKLCTVGVSIFFFVVSLFFAQLDFIAMFLVVMTSLWLGAAGPIMIGGLYTRFGTTFGAWCALFFGSGTSLLGLILQRNWAAVVYPWLDARGYTEAVGHFFKTVSGPFNPYVVWEMNPIKFPVNSVEIYFLAMIFGVAGYVFGSLITFREPFNLDRLLHRGLYSGDAIPAAAKVPWRRRLFSLLIGITPEYTRGDKIIAWSVFVWSIVYGFGVMFCGTLIWNLISPWPPQRWAVYFFITNIVAALVVGTISTIWFMVGGFLDLRALFRDLARRVADPLDDGRVVGHVSLADKTRFDAIEHPAQPPTAGESPAQGGGRGCSAPPSASK